jgi:hypothetical protein
MGAKLAQSPLKQLYTVAVLPSRGLAEFSVASISARRARAFDRSSLAVHSSCRIDEEVLCKAWHAGLAHLLDASPFPAPKLPDFRASATARRNAISIFGLLALGCVNNTTRARQAVFVEIIC